MRGWVRAVSCWLMAGTLAAVAATAAAGASKTILLPAGGLLLIGDDRLVVEAQEVILGRQAIRATYAVRNTSSEVLSRIISWPMQEIDANSIGDEVVVLPAADAKNFAAAAVAVDGVAVPLAFEQRAIAYARDVTAILQSNSIPLNPITPGTEERLAALHPERLAEFEERGIVRRDAPRVVGTWTLQSTAYWRQTFEPGKLVTMSLAYGPISASDVWSPELAATARDTYCLDAAQEQSIAAKVAQNPRGLVTHRLTYVVNNEPGWWAPIPKFRLAIEKPAWDSVVATCQKGFRIVGPTLIEWIGEAWQPTDDLKVMIIK